jgi:hypothetical protein
MSTLEELNAQIKFFRDMGVKHKATKAKCLTENQKSLQLLNSKKANMVAKIKNISSEIIPTNIEYEFMEPYANLTTMNESLYFEATKMLKQFNGVPKYDEHLNIRKYYLDPYGKSIFDSILQLETKYFNLSTPERELFNCIKGWEENIKDNPTPIIIEIVRTPKRFVTNKYWCRI